MALELVKAKVPGPKVEIGAGAILKRDLVWVIESGVRAYGAVPGVFAVGKGTGGGCA